MEERYFLDFLVDGLTVVHQRDVGSMIMVHQRGGNVSEMAHHKVAKNKTTFNSTHKKHFKESTTEFSSDSIGGQLIILLKLRWNSVS